MIKQIIFKGKVHYKIGDLAKMHGVSPRVMKRILKEQNIETTTIKGFGRMLFAIDKNVSVEIVGEDTIAKTIKGTIRKEKAEKAKKAAEKLEKEAKKAEKDSEEKNDVAEPVSDSIESDIEHTEKQEHSNLLKEINEYGVIFFNADKMPEANEITARHLEGNLPEDTTEADNPSLRSLVAELKTITAEWNVLPPVDESVIEESLQF